ncbi:hypothetical protein QNI16_11535 [Cytophagaceae bacterium YF14B1]|uniref:Uncharacterized protein n=1 Tax=Xanthocytophaga flava TaxID=3048013 RepID=A0AAE3QQY9_9BACT|nr:hypothetical protein [Xanthocytophaga flavus]MDJ1481118.1 hypothetical protein [Xanthocytophaga flavus]
MRPILIIALFLLTTFSNAQVTLNPTDLKNLLAISQLYSQFPNGGDKFAKEAEKLRTPVLNHMVDALMVAGNGNKEILENRFLARPSDEELVLWYVIREIHYNRTNEKQAPRPDSTVANEVLSKKIDTRWLLDNYYYRIHGGIASLFNKADLVKYNFNIDEMGFKDETEKAIFFLNMMESLIGGRFKVLQAMKNNKSILEFAAKLPTFNGKAYYYYKRFDYEDFKWIGYDKEEFYNERHIGNLFSTLIAHFSALAGSGEKKAAQEVYFKSILHEPKYFKFTPLKDDLQSFYNQSK